VADGLNLQIKHRRFPQCAGYATRTIRPIVTAAAATHGAGYNKRASLMPAAGLHVRMLMWFSGKPPAPAG
jgi:hypothetical protein